MGRLQFIKRAQFAPSVTSVCLIQADIYSSGRQKYVFLTFNNPEAIWHHDALAKITPYDEDRKPLKAFGINLDLTMLPPGGFFTYPEEIPLPIEAVDFNFEFLKIDGIQAPEYTPVRAFGEEPTQPVAKPAPAPAPAADSAEPLPGVITPEPTYEGPAPQPIGGDASLHKKAQRGAKHVEIVDYGHRRIRKTWLWIGLAIALGLGVASAIFINPYPENRGRTPAYRYDGSANEGFQTEPYTLSNGQEVNL